jgi:hypothetical protein
LATDLEKETDLDSARETGWGLARAKDSGSAKETERD